MENIKTQAKKTELIIFDIDGVMTDGSLLLGDDGQEYKAFNSRDGHGIRMLHECGIKSAIITGRTSNVVKLRAQELDIDIVMQGYRDKRPAFQELLRQTGISTDNIAYVGDDVIDLPVMSQVGFAIAVNDAHPYVIKNSHWTTQKPGGRGAAREVCEFILSSKGLLDDKLKTYME